MNRTWRGANRSDRKLSSKLSALTKFAHEKDV